MSLHVEPVDDLIQHLDDDCPCSPYVEFIDSDTGVTYPDGPLVIHHSLDGREFKELTDDS